MTKLPDTARPLRGRMAAPELKWIAPLGAPDDGPQWARVDLISDFRDLGPGPFPGTRQITMRYMAEPVTVRVTDRSWHMATCRQCTPHQNMPFATPGERKAWLDEHHAETGHRYLYGWEEGRG